MARLFAWMELAACWIAWAYPYLFRAPHLQKRPSITVTGPTRAGLLFETIAVGVAFFPLPSAPRTGVAPLVAALAFGILGVLLAWTGVAHLGRQFRVHAGLYADHELVRTGPYALVRHPIYASILAQLLATIVLLTPWPRAVVSLALFVLGTEIRIRSEDALLASRFGDEFAKYKKSVSAYVPFVR